MIELQHITQRYRTPEGRDFFALNDVSLSIKSGEIFGIIGRSGAGKSTLVRCINFLNRPTEGTVTVDGKCLNTMTNAELRAARRQIAMIFQHFNILSSRTVYDNAAFPLELAGWDKTEIRKKVEPLLDLVGLADHRNKYPSQLLGRRRTLRRGSAVLHAADLDQRRYRRYRAPEDTVLHQHGVPDKRNRFARIGGAEPSDRPHHAHADPLRRGDVGQLRLRA